MGRRVKGGGYNDVWRSVNRGKDWSRRTPLPIDGDGGRFSASLLISFSKILRVDVLTYLGGISRVENGGPSAFYNGHSHTSSSSLSTRIPRS